MARYELTDLQVENLKALILDATIKGSAAHVIVELLGVLDNPVNEDQDIDLHGKHNDGKEHGKDSP